MLNHDVEVTSTRPKLSVAEGLKLLLNRFLLPRIEIADTLEFRAN